MDTDIAALQSHLTRIFTAIGQHEEEVILTPEPGILVWVRDAPGGARVMKEHGDGTDAVAGALIEVTMLISEFPTYIRACPGPLPRKRQHRGPVCNKVFAGRSDQWFCSPNCAARHSRQQDAPRFRPEYSSRL